MLLSNRGGKFAGGEEEDSEMPEEKAAEEAAVPAEAAEVEDVSDDIPF
jgi:hypothetical protein